mgnify:CR=1 FL=1
MPIEFSREQCRIYKEELGKIIKRRYTDRTSGDNGSDFISCRKFCYQSDGSDAICRIWNCTENRFLYYAGSVLYHAECISICCAEYRCRKEKPGMEGFYTAIITGCSVGIIIFMVGFFGGGVLSSFFTNDSEVIAQSAAYLKGFSADCILTCVLFSSIGIFNGCGKSIPVMIQESLPHSASEFRYLSLCRDYRKHL